MKQCKRGHARTPKNVDEHRRCIACKKDHDRAYSDWYRSQHSPLVKERQRLAYAANPLRRRGNAKAAIAWAKHNPKRRRLIRQGADAKRRAAQKSRGSWSVVEWVALRKKFKNRCIGCGKTLRQLKRLCRVLSPDHVIPLVKGGSNRISNIQPLCHGRGSCNLKKGVQIIDFRRAFAAHA